MTRLRRRPHVPGGLHYVILHANEGRDVFEDLSDHEAFTQLVERSVRRWHVLVHAFCWLPRAVHLAVEVSTFPLGRFIQQITGVHARAMNRKRVQRGHVFEQRYWAVLLEEPSQLPEVMRHIHLAPVHARLAADPADYAWTSHHTYLGCAKCTWVTTSTVLGMLEARTTYRDYIRQEPCSPAATHTTSQRDSDFLDRLTRHRRRKLDPVLLNRIVDSVAIKLCVSRDAILSPSRRRSLSLARALVVWHATKNEVATLSDVAQWFDRNPSTLCAGLERYREARSDLFDQPMQDLLTQSGAHAFAESPQTAAAHATAPD